MSETTALEAEQGLMATLQELHDELRGPGHALSPQDRLADDLGIDSLQMMEILVALEERLGVEIVGDPRVFDMTTVDDLLGLLHALRASTPADRDDEVRRRHGT